MRSDKLAFHDYYRKFYEQVFFPYLWDNDITEVIQTGDLFDRRKFVNFNTLHLSKEYFFNEFSKPFKPLKLHTYPGNHDIYYRNTLEVNSINLLLKEYISHGFINFYNTPTTITFDEIPIDFIPWICPDNEQQIKQFIQNSKSEICFGHFQIQGFEMERGHTCVEGMTRGELNKYEMVISGHFHHRSTDGHIFYVGSPGEMTWADYDDTRGFHIFDTSTRELEFIENPFRIHHKIIYDDTNETLENITSADYSLYANNIVKVIIQQKNNPVLFDAFMDSLSIAQPVDISIVEDFSDTNISDDDVIDQADDTITIISKVIDGVDTSLDKDKLKGIMRDIYLDALNFDNIRDIT